MGEYSPWADLAARYPGVHVERCDCRPARGVLVLEERVILLSRDLDWAGRRSTLAHDIAHLDLDHNPTGHRHFDARQERHADLLAARRLLTLDDLARVVGWTMSTVEAAAELGVTHQHLQLRVEHLHPAERHALRRLTQVTEGAA